jgi:hypothetical protein
VLTSHPVFVHRLAAEGIVVSFCRKCLMTVASSQSEAELDGPENEHKCDPLRLEYVCRFLPSQEYSNGNSGSKLDGAPRKL